jgi:adenylyltransferase/sulfurtransferase
VTGAGGGPLDEARVARYARQLLVPGFGEAAQQRLGEASVRAIGAGPIASPALVYLAQAGVGRIWIDDQGPIAAGEAGWLGAVVGRPRAEAVAEALSQFSRFVSVERYPMGGVPTAALVAATTVAQALHAAEAARRAGIPHVVLEPDDDGGAVVSIPPGGPCYACARSTSSPGRPPAAGAAALSALAAQELVQMIALPGTVPGRRLDLVRGVASVRATTRLAGCACSRRSDASQA